jgi:hypothetical protein
MEARHSLVIVTVALAAAGMVGAFVAWRDGLVPAGAAFMARDASKVTALDGLAHAIMCLNRTWSSPECGGAFGPGYAGQAGLAYDDGSEADIAVEASASDTRRIRAIGRADRDGAHATAAYRAEARIDAEEGGAEGPSLSGDGAFGWRLVPGTTTEIR